MHNHLSKNWKVNSNLFQTLGMAGVCGYVTGKLDTEVVFYAFLLTVVVTLTITTIAVFCPVCLHPF